MRAIVVALYALSLSACAAPRVPPRLGLKLAPSSLVNDEQPPISLQQHIRVERQNSDDELDVALEIDAAHLEMVALALGHRVMSLSFDGLTTKAWRHPMVPAMLRAEDVLDDLQLALWPHDAIEQALPPGWSLDDNDKELQRTLLYENTPMVEISYSQLPRWSGTLVLMNLRYHYQLTIESVENAP